MPKKIPELSKSQIGRIRANLARQASVIGDRVSKCATGELELTQQQLTAAKLILGHVLPAMQQQEIEVTDNKHGQVEDVKQAMADLQQQALKDLSPEHLRAIADQKENTDALQ